MCERERVRERELLAIHKTAKTLENAQHENLRVAATSMMVVTGMRKWHEQGTYRMGDE